MLARGPVLPERTLLIGCRAWEVSMVGSGRRRRVFPDAFKREAVASVRGGRSVSQVAAELGVGSGYV
jgi:hypothetical protein